MKINNHLYFRDKNCFLMRQIKREDRQPFLYHIYVDFDSTFINERLLVQWVFYNLQRSDLSSAEKMRFAVDSSYRGVISAASSYSEITSPFAVKLAFRTFKNIHKKTADEFITSQCNGKYLINLNMRLTDSLSVIADCIRNHLRGDLKIVIYSQGSFKYAIKTFLYRKDVRELLDRLKLPIDAADEGSILANDLITVNDIFTGELKAGIVTKYNRIEELSGNPNPYVFIGDDRDETVIGQQKKHIRFIHHKALSVMSAEEIGRLFISESGQQF